MRRAQAWTQKYDDGKCKKHPESGLTEWGTCYECYSEKYSSKPPRVFDPDPALAEIQSIAGNVITVSSPTQLAWTAGPGTLVLPVFLARISDQVKVDRLFSGADMMDLEFIGEAQQPAPAPLIALTQYQGEMAMFRQLTSGWT
jgi:hypothetical protein